MKIGTELRLNLESDHRLHGCQARIVDINITPSLNIEPAMSVTVYLYVYVDRGDYHEVAEERMEVSGTLMARYLNKGVMEVQHVD